MLPLSSNCSPLIRTPSTLPCLPPLYSAPHPLHYFTSPLLHFSSHLLPPHPVNDSLSSTSPLFSDSIYSAFFLSNQHLYQGLTVDPLFRSSVLSLPPNINISTVQYPSLKETVMGVLARTDRIDRTDTRPPTRMTPHKSSTPNPNPDPCQAQRHRSGRGTSQFGCSFRYTQHSIVQLSVA